MKYKTLNLIKNGKKQKILLFEFVIFDGYGEYYKGFAFELHLLREVIPSTNDNKIAVSAKLQQKRKKNNYSKTLIRHQHRAIFHMNLFKS